MLEIDTPRLTLSHLAEADAADLQRLYQDPEVVRFMRPPVVTLEQQIETVRRHRERYADAPLFGYRAGRLKSTGEMVGRYGLVQVVVDGRDELEISYLTDSRFRGQRLAAEAGAAMLEAAGRLGVTRVVAVILPGNVGSIRVAEGLGFRFEREVSFEDYGMVRLYGWHHLRQFGA